MSYAPPVSIGITVQKGGKKGKPRKGNLVSQYENQKLSNYDLLYRLGFDDKLIEENKRLGLKEKRPVQSMT